MATATKIKKRKDAYPWKACASGGHIANLKQSILRLSISMVVALSKEAKVSNATVFLPVELCYVNIS